MAKEKARSRFINGSPGGWESAWTSCCPTNRLSRLIVSARQKQANHMTRVAFPRPMAKLK